MSKQRLGQAFVSAGSTTRRSSRSAAECIGRVGALAASLGVGAVLFAAPWTAAADAEGSSGSGDTSSTSEAGSTESTESSSTAQATDDSTGDSSAGETESDDAEPESSSDDGDLEAELTEELGEELDDIEDDTDSEEEDGSSSGDGDAPVDLDDVTAADTVAKVVTVEEDVDSGGGSGPVESESEPVVDVDAAVPAAPEVLPESAPVEEMMIEVEETAPSRSSYTSASVMSARTSTEEITEAPAKALQAQPGTFLEVASSMLSAVIAPFVTTPAAPAAPSAQPLMWGVLSWVRRELDDTFANFSISIGGRQIVQNGTAYATSQGFGSFAIAHGENAVASASGLFNVAIVRGDDSTATSEGNFTRVRVRGDDNTAGADGPGSRASIYGDQNTAETTGAYTSIYVRGVGNAVTGTGDGTRATVTGDDNDATVLATNGSRAQITVRGDENSATASADDDSTALVRIIGDGSTAVADAEADGYAAARITGDSNVASSDAMGETSIVRITGDDNAAWATASQARAEATVFGDSNFAEANDGNAVISGDGSIADADGPGSVARVWGDGSTASALGEDNTAFVWGDDSRAIAGPGTGNTAISLGNNLVADTGPGDGNTVYGQPFDPENQAPVAGAPGAQTVDPQTGTVIGTLGFTDPDGDTLTYTATDPTNGSVTINAQAGTYTYTPATRPAFGDPDGADSFTVTASDGQASAMTTIDVPVTALPEPGNQAPQAGLSGPWQINEETGVVTATLGFTDPDGDPLTYEVTEQPDNGVVTVDTEAGTFTYTPATRPEPGQPDGEDSFTVVASDPDGLTATNTIGLPIVALPEPDNQAPVAGAPGEQIVDPETGSVTGSLGFTDPDGDELTYTATDPTNGSVTIDAEAGTFTYTPANRPEAGEPDGADAFTVTATDPDGLSASTTIDVPVTALPDPDNTAPVANADTYSLDEDTPLVIAGPGVLANDTDADGDPLTAVLGTGPAHGTFALNPDGSFSYTPNDGYSGTDTFTYAADDGEETSALTTVTLTVNPVDDPADLGNDTATVGEGSTDNVINVLANDSDPDGELTVTAVGAAANGTTSITGDGLSVVYTPDPDYIGEDTFTYTVTDPAGGTGTATVTVTVAGLVNQPPVAGPPGEQSIYLETGTVTGTLGITDPEGAFLNYTIASGPSLGSVEIDFLGNYTYTPDPENRPAFGEEDGTDSFTVIAADPTGASAQTTITVPVVAELNAENQAPVAGTPGPLMVDAETGEVSGSFDFITDPDGDELDFTPFPGGFDSVIYYSDGTFTYIPSTASRLRGDATQTLTVIATDPSGLSVTADIEIPIVPAQVSVVDTIANVGTFLTNIAAAPDGSVVYVSNGGVTLGDSVLVIDPVTNTVVDEITVGANPDGITFAADGSTAYVVSADDGTLVVIDTASGSVVDAIDLDNNNPREVTISPDGLRAYVSANDFVTSSGILVVDLDPDSPTFRTVIDEFRIDEEGASELGFNNYGDRLYVVTLRSVIVIDGNPASPTFNTVVDTIEIGDDAESIGIPTSGPFAYGAYVVDQGSNSIAVVDQSDDTVIDTVAVGNDPSDVAFSPDGSVAYVVNLGDENGGTLTVIDVENHTVIDTLVLGLAPASVAVGPDGTVYVANAFGGTVSVVGIVPSSSENL
ncbi:Ig-like domain-containing protein [Mycolicibacterium poriferae]|uniref:Ig-like domain-containing protein n=2 Tax=Mycolicibacterium poriferae TaxID=39694 RepID=UPI0024B987F3|nr:Ig-like domain-containing protein [Mycolicibacterium poriferae]